MANLQVGVAGNGTVTVGAGASVHSPASNTLTLGTNGDERLRIDSSGRVKIGGTAVSQNRDLVVGSNAEANLAIETHNDATSESSNIRFFKSGNTGASPQVVETDDNIGSIQAYGYDGTDYNSAAAKITFAVDGAPGSNDMPGKIALWTTADGATSPTERLRITAAGAWGIAGTNYGTSGQFLKSGGSGAAVSRGDAGGGIDDSCQWRLTSPLQGNQTPLTGWELVDTYGGGGFGSAMSESSGIFTFPSTGWWSVVFHLAGYSDNSSQNVIGQIMVTTDNSSYNHTCLTQQGIYDMSNSYPSHASTTAQALVDVTSTTNVKVRFDYGAGQGGEYAKGHTTYTYTNAIFTRLGDT